MKSYTLKEQADAVQEEIDNLRQSFTDQDGNVEDNNIVEQIVKLEAAVDTLRDLQAKNGCL